MQDHLSTLFLADNGYKTGFVNNFFLASKGEVERKLDQHNVIINQLVEQVNALTPVNGIQCCLSCVTCLQYNAHAMTHSVAVVDAVKLVYAQGFNGTNGINGNDGMHMGKNMTHSTDTVHLRFKYIRFMVDVIASNRCIGMQVLLLN